MAIPDSLTSKAVEPGGTGITCSEHNYSSPPNSGIVICPQCRIVTALAQWRTAFVRWWLEANASRVAPLTMTMELYQASCDLNIALENRSDEGEEETRKQWYRALFEEPNMKEPTRPSDPRGGVQRMNLIERLGLLLIKWGECLAGYVGSSYHKSHR